jgi:hypothetical protein
VFGFLPDPTPEPSVSPTYSPTLYPRPFGKSGKGSKSSKSYKGSKATKTLKYVSKSGKSAKSGDRDDYKGLFGDYKRVTGTLQKQEGVFEVSYNKSSAQPSRSIGASWFAVVSACLFGALSVMFTGL